MTPDSLRDSEIKEINLRPGEFFFGEGNIRIQTLLGSCVAITFWHPKKRIGGMCHYLLSHRGSNKKWPKGAFADECIELFMIAIKHAHTIPSEYEIKLFGGSTMFGNSKNQRDRNASPSLKSMIFKNNLALLANDENNISTINIEVGFALLKKHNLKVKASDVGGFTHRNIYLELSSGDVWVKRDRSH